MFQSAFKLVTVKCIREYLSKNNVSVLSLIMFNDNKKILMYKVIGEGIYTIIDDYICLDYLGFIQEKASKHDNKFENTKFNDLSELVIPDIFMDIISFYGFVKYSILTVILSCCNDLVSHFYRICHC